MITITDVFKYLIYQAAKQLRAIKTANLTYEIVEKYAYVLANKKGFRNKLPEDLPNRDQWQFIKVKYEKLIGFISPKDVRWSEYQRTKHRVSLLLTARHIHKLHQESVPNIKQVRSAVKKGLLANHAHTKRVSSLNYQALRCLVKLNNRLTKRPEKFADVEQWLMEIKLRSAKDNNKKE